VSIENTRNLYARTIRFSRELRYPAARIGSLVTSTLRIEKELRCLLETADAKNEKYTTLYRTPKQLLRIAAYFHLMSEQDMRRVRKQYCGN